MTISSLVAQISWYYRPNGIDTLHTFPRVLLNSNLGISGRHKSWFSCFMNLCMRSDCTLAPHKRLSKFAFLSFALYPRGSGLSASEIFPVESL